MLLILYDILLKNTLKQIHLLIKALYHVFLVKSNDSFSIICNKNSSIFRN